MTAILDEDIETPTAEPLVAPLAVETARWYTVSNVPHLPDAQGREFRVTQLKLWDRPFKGWMAVLYGYRTDGGGRAAKVFTADHDAEQLPDWVRPLLLSGARADTAHLMAQIDRYARDFLNPAVLVDAERDDIERQIEALSVAAHGAGMPDRRHAGLGLPCEVCPGACVIDRQEVSR